jgi:hypothetical protein
MMPNPEQGSGSGQNRLTTGAGQVRTNPVQGNAGQPAAGLGRLGSVRTGNVVSLPPGFQQGSYFICDLCSQKTLGAAQMGQLEGILQKYQ